MRITAYLRRPANPYSDKSMNVKLRDLLYSFTPDCITHIKYRDEPLDLRDTPDLIIHWGYQPRSRQLLDAKANGIPILVMDCGYFFHRRDNLSLGYNGLNGTAFRPPPGAAPRPHPELRPWVDNQGQPLALVCGQLSGDASLQIDGLHSTDEWCVEKSQELAQKGYQVVTRPHPLQPMMRNAPVFREIVRDFDLVATWSSNAGVEAIFNGVPATAESPVSMISGFSGRSTWEWNLAGPEYPTIRDAIREKWAHDISYAQFNPEEMGDGTAARHVMTGYDEARAKAENGEYA